jgi:hypothetical protein
MQPVYVAVDNVDMFTLNMMAFQGLASSTESPWPGAKGSSELPDKNAIITMIQVLKPLNGLTYISMHFLTT